VRSLAAICGVNGKQGRAKDRGTVSVRRSANNYFSSMRARTNRTSRSRNANEQPFARALLERNLPSWSSYLHLRARLLARCEIYFALGPALPSSLPLLRRSSCVIKERREGFLFFCFNDRRSLLRKRFARARRSRGLSEGNLFSDTISFRVSREFILVPRPILTHLPPVPLLITMSGQILNELINRAAIRLRHGDGKR